ncbi:MAG: hypothetical protein DMF53_08170 [Acidobacteria bacterium]|nr:MAG: hypothetical protein DMF53_08170 [Acidobacteriota bacterium]
MAGDINPWKLMEAHAAELRALGVRRIGVFGSFAKGEAKPESDVDVISSRGPSIS